MKKLLLFFLVFIVLFQHSKLTAQDNRGQYPTLLRNGFFEVNIGYINYPFSVKQLEPGYTVESIQVPHTAVRINLGYNFNEYFSFILGYMRPILWVRYKNVNGDGRNHPVFMNVGSTTLKGELPFGEKFSIYGEGGMGLITRSGFHVSNEPDQIIVKDATFATVLMGAGIKYKPNARWGIMLNTAYTPPHSKTDQPRTTFFSAGFSFAMKPLPVEKVEASENSKYIFPHNMIQLCYTTNAFGYGVNNFVSEGKIPIFWGGKAEVRSGISVHYQRNVFHTRKTFALDWGASFSYYKTENTEENFWALSLFPVFRFTVLHLSPFDLYFNYSLAGPTFISDIDIDGEETGPKFTFQDFMGMGFFFGKTRKINAEIRIAHYSNGNLFPQNAGVKIPLTFNMGYTF